MSVVIEAIQKLQLADKQILVACSGGLDSTVLVHGLVQAGYRPVVVHINYQLRGNDSEEDEKSVRELCDILHLKLMVVKCPLSVTKGKGINLQQAARDFRRSVFVIWKAKSQHHIVCLAHHQDDQIETFFLQLFRGSGVDGLGGMHLEKNQIIRPFLGLNKQQIRDFAFESAIIWREDKSNSENDYQRNLWRNELLPELIKRQPNLDNSVLLLMEQFRNRQAEIQLEIQPVLEEWNNILNTNKAIYSIEISTWNQLSKDQKMAFLREINSPVWAINQLDNLMNSETGKYIETNYWIIERYKNSFVWHQKQEGSSERKIFRELVNTLPLQFSKDEIYLDTSKICGELTLRFVQHGDRIASIGMKGTQLISDVLKDAGISIIERKAILVLADNEHIHWIPNLKIGRIAIATNDSTQILKIVIG